MKILLTLPLAVLVAGCASINQKVETPVTVNTTNGPQVVLATYENRITCWGNGKNIVDKTRISVGKTTSMGATGVQQEMTLTDLIQALTEMLKVARPTP